MPNKPTKYGIKAFTLASSNHGYLLNVLLYTGVDTLADTDQAYSASAACSCCDALAASISRQGASRIHGQVLQQYTVSTGSCSETDALHMYDGEEPCSLPNTVRASSFRLRDDVVRAFRAGSLLTVAWRAATKKKPLIMLSSSCAHETVTVRSRRTTQQSPWLWTATTTV